MLRNSSGGHWRDPQGILRITVGVLLAASLVATGFVLFPPGGSAEELDRQLTSLEVQVATRTKQLEQSKQHAAAIDSGRGEGDQFLNDYFLPSRTASSTVASDLDTAATVAKINAREHAYASEPIDGSD